MMSKQNGCAKTCKFSNKSIIQLLKNPKYAKNIFVISYPGANFFKQNYGI